MASAWQESFCGLSTGIDWADWLGCHRAIDPYLVWADLCDLAGHSPSGDGADAKWPFIVELDVVRTVRQPDGSQAPEVPCILACLDIDPLHVEKTGDDGPWRTRGRHITARATPGTVAMMLRAQELVRFQLGLPRMPPTAPGATRVRTRQAGGTLARVVVGVIDDGCAFANPAFQDASGVSRVRYLWDQDHRRKGEQGWSSMQAIAGYGAELRPDELMRTVAQGKAAGPRDAYEAAAYGMFKPDPDTLSTMPVAADGSTLPLDAQLLGSHGTAVMHLAAGFPNPLRGQRQPLSAQQATLPRQVADPVALGLQLAQLAARLESADEQLAALDIADQWPLVFAQLPTRTVLDTSGGSLAVHVLDAVRYITHRARTIPYVEDGVEILPSVLGAEEFTDNRVVINLSFGSTAGGHDGTSILEQALAEIVAQQSKTWIVVAAGNAHRARQHARVTLVRGGRRSFHFAVGPDNPQESYLEIWLPDCDSHGKQLSEQWLRELHLDIHSPDGSSTSMIMCGQSRVLHALEGPPRAAAIFCRRVAQGTRGTMVLLAVAPTRPQGHRDGRLPREPGPHGMWRIDLGWAEEGSVAGAPLHIDAWCERNDLVFGQPRGQQAAVYADFDFDTASENDPEALAYLAFAGRGSTAHRPPAGLVRRPTMSSPSMLGDQPAMDSEFDPQAADSQGVGQVLVVGGRRLSDAEVAAYSGSGPARAVPMGDWWSLLQGQPASGGRYRPDLDAPSDLSPSVPGLRTTGLQAGTLVRLAGTSLAAPSAARALANFLYWRVVDLNAASTVRPVGRANDFKARVAQAAEPRGSATTPEARATLTPRTDDAFRRGAIRLR